jgi:peptidylprolyl isomerase
MRKADNTMAQAKEGDKVKVHYTGRFENGDVFDSSECADDDCGCAAGPLEFTIGEGEVIPGFEMGVIGMNVGDSKTLNIPVDEAYGDRHDEMVAVVEREHIPAELTPVVGMRLEVTQEDGKEFPVIITEVTDSHVTLDANHPLAGRDLIFDIRLMEIG